MTPADEPSGDVLARYLDLARASDQPVIVCTGGLIRFVNDAAIGILGAVDAEPLISEPLDRFVDLSGIDASDPAHSPVNHVEVDVSRLDGSRARMCVAWMSCRFDRADGVQVLMRHVASRRRLEHEVRFLARHDDLTEMPNRLEFRDRLTGAIARAQRGNRLVGVLGLNIDRFRNVNAAHGADGGDAVLQAVAARLVGSIRKTDSAARIGGDEFGVILEGLEQRSQAAVAANRVLAAIRQPVPIGDAQLTITASAGIAAFPVDAEDIDTLLRLVDVALFASKTSGGNGFRFYGAEMESQSPRDLARREQTLKRIEALAPREREVMEMLVEGNHNKSIGYLLGASPGAIESHRAKIMLKMRAESLPDLVRMVIEARGPR